MKKILPKNNVGFTLVELMVVVTIIAILSVIGLVIFGGMQKTARDARRHADIDAIANAMEANFDKGTTRGQYAALSASFFSSGVIPLDPIDTTALSCNGKTCKYCARDDPSATNAVAGACEATDAIVTGSTGSIVGNPSGSTDLYWVVCANLESATPAYYCRKNIQ